MNVHYDMILVVESDSLLSCKVSTLGFDTNTKKLGKRLMKINLISSSEAAHMV